MTRWKSAAKWWLWMVILWCCGLESAWGQMLGSVAEDAVELGSVVVTATKTEVPVKQVAASVTVITREEIEARQVTQVSDLLRDVPGLSVRQQSSRGSVVSIFPRGGNSNFNLVLIDGVKVNDAGGFYDFGDFSADNIERIEIVRGPHSALYGSDAMGSVIQIFTRRGKGTPRVETSFGGGNLKTFEEKLNLSGGAGQFDYSFGVGRNDTGGNLPINNHFGETTVSSRVGFTLEKVLDLGLAVRYTDSHLHFPTETGDRFNGVKLPLDPDQSSDQQRLVVSGKASHALTPWWGQTLQLGWYRRNYALDDPFNSGIDFSTFRSDSEERRFSLDYSWNLTAPTVLNISSLLTAGFAFEREEFEQQAAVTATDFPSSSANAARRDNKAGYLQGQFDWRKQLFLTAGFRVDGNSTFGTEVTPRVSAAWIVPYLGTKLRGGYGEGIKEPSFVENFGDGSQFIVGNPHLKPERIRGWEIGFDQPFFHGLADFSATYFHNHFQDLIAFIFSPTSGCSASFCNVQKAKAEGVEFAATIRPGYGLTIGGGYTFLDTKVLNDGGIGSVALQNGERLLRRPKHAGTLSIDHVWRRLHTSLTTTFVGNRSDIFTDPATFSTERVRADGYITVDLAGSYLLLKDTRHLRELTLFGRIQNLFDRNYQQVAGFSAPGITWLFGLKGSL
ncbi:TonB-dependent outer membrane receptor for cobalamin and Fe transport [Candidatus Methylomirabilis lanthanidiphila]|uniref:TonB-dependent outer membrane receptor for cobalamin and Fe transport n=1 Tax=Candidatus Methylomirabilis lanthanidiphila TaxID=2211376 RepID=A0A564ZLM5_9BACT|nr:TonB-dependent outer membrane receptor for cobalamin and Fe transport [Candidatus Methylomirabilis lanthanidiphila]